MQVTLQSTALLTLLCLQGLLQLLALPIDPGNDCHGAALPAMGALSDLLEHLVAARGRLSSAGSGAYGKEAGVAVAEACGNLDSNLR